MSDLIKRKDVIDALEQRLEDNYLDGCELLKYIKVLPSAEPEQKKGKWVYDGIRGRFPVCKCSICGQQPKWNGKPLIMILDHINGNHRDDRLENLRWVCPNCNYQ